MTADAPSASVTSSPPRLQLAIIIILAIPVLATIALRIFAISAPGGLFNARRIHGVDTPMIEPDDVPHNNQAMGLDVHQPPHVPQDIFQWLGAHFSDPVGLLRSMRCGSFILSGSRAASYFFPNLSTPSSDFDFYCYASARCIGIAIRALAHSGVVFDHWYDPLLKIVQSHNAVETLHVDDFRAYWRHYAERFRPAPEVVVVALRLIHDALELDEYQQFVLLDCGVIVNLLRDRRRGAYGYSSPTMNIITGYTTHNGTSQKVQLIWGGNKAPMDHIMDFYGSIVQAFITGYGAAHLYYFPGNRGISFFWPRNTQNRRSADDAVAKYRERGVTTIYNTDTTRAIHTFGGDTAVVAPFELDVESSRLDIARSAALSALTWESGGGETILLRRVTSRMRKLLQANRVDRKRMRLVGFIDDSTITLVMEHSVAFDHASHSVYPDEVLGF